jgi:WD40 repeat protein/serine/threonine protein kinase
MTSPDDDARTIRLTRLLASYDEARAAGHPPAIAETVPPTVDSGDADRLLADQRCVNLLDRLWPRTPTPDPVALERIGRFRIVRELGRGGFGIVYLAHDPVLGREIALKVPLPTALLNPDLRQRFLREARAAAQLDHPNLVPVFEAGEDGPLCYLVSAYCDGVTLRRWLNERVEPVPYRDAARLAAALADGVAYMHSRGISHRDIKPTNVMLPVDKAGAADLGSPRLTDFGLAKLEADEHDPTRSGMLMGTPRYMAPEQAEGRVRDVGPATDVHGLGMLLYELLTGCIPYSGLTDLETLQRIAKEDLPPLRWTRREIPRDLEAICQNCLEKQPSRRYASAQALADDLRRFMAGQPTDARPLTALQRSIRWARRRSTTTALLLLLFVAVLGWLPTSSWLGSQRQEVREITDAPANPATRTDLKTKQIAHALQLARLAEQWQHGEAHLLWPQLNELRPHAGEEDLRGFAWRYLYERGRNVRLLPEQSSPVVDLTFSRDGRSWYSVDATNAVKRWSASTDRLEEQWQVHGSTNVGNGAFASDATRLVAAAKSSSDIFQLLVWDASSGRVLQGPLMHHWADPTFSPDGRTVAYATNVGDGTALRYEVRLWDTVTGCDQVLRPEDTITVTKLRFSPDSKALAISCKRNQAGVPSYPLELWEVTTRKQQWQANGHFNTIIDLAFSPESQILATTGSYDGSVCLWNTKTGQELRRLAPNCQGTERVAFSPDGNLLAVTEVRQEEGKVRGKVSLWRVSDGTKLESELDTDVHVLALAFAPDSQSLVVADWSKHLRRWEPFAKPAFQVLSAHAPFEAWAVAFAPDGRTLATVGDFGQARLWDAVTGKKRASLDGHAALVSCLAYSPQGNRLATGSHDYTAKLWDAEGRLVATCPADDCVLAVAFSPDGKLLATTGRDRMVRLWDAENGRPQATLCGHTNHVHALAFSPDGKFLASGETDKQIRIWNPTSRELVRVLATDAPIRGLAFSPDGKTLASGDSGGQVKLWRPDTGEGWTLPQDHPGKEIRRLVFSPDGKTIATADMDLRVRLRCAAAGFEQLTFGDLPHTPSGLAFSPDGQRLAVALHDGTVRIWNAPHE